MEEMILSGFNEIEAGQDGRQGKNVGMI